MTINLQNRKEVDFNLIKRAAKKKPRTFTELLHITKLSRKTLSLRLKELCSSGILVKKDGTYKLDGAFEVKDNDRGFLTEFSRIFDNRKMKISLMLIAFLLGSSVSGYVFATLLVQQQFPQKQAKGHVIMSVNVTDVKDLYAWQVVISFNSNELEVADITSEKFVGIEYPLFVNATDIGEGVLLLGGSLFGRVPGKNVSDSRRLATIVFEYFVDEYEYPVIIPKIGRFETQLWDSKGYVISDSNSLLELFPIEDS